MEHNKIGALQIIIFILVYNGIEDIRDSKYIYYLVPFDFILNQISNLTSFIRIMTSTKKCIIKTYSMLFTIRLIWCWYLIKIRKIWICTYIKQTIIGMEVNTYKVGK